MTGSAGFEAMLDGITERVEAAIPGAAFKAMEHVRQVAVNRTPLEDGDLRTSASVVPTPEGANVVYDSVYSRYQEYEHLHHEVGQRLYLTTTIIGEAPKVMGILTSELGKAIG
ncbi:HK97 gp10 family phage protein [Arthrobacter cavernae]|uniref:HK97 gp10 family phage protein n=1 Tax=Arthrobacter cavernae TaxID=2817681 RepID=A0A939KKD6_9MICC|nr:HK97 gp10 family phage protein [Arthrobacter cavernae]MBO1269607.1 HK97 gp10 family phage protein [Arthrobacter cavernae]